MPNVTRLLLTFAGAAVISAPCLSGCSDPVPATPQAVVTSNIGPGTAGAAACSTNHSVFWAIGSGSGGDVPVKDGDNINGATVGVECRVAGNDSAGYDVTARATLAGKGTVAISGHFSGTRDPQPNISGTFTDATGLGTFREQDCTVTFTGNDQGIAGGRVWATIKCPNAIDSNVAGRSCEGDSMFRFENCAQ